MTIRIKIALAFRRLRRKLARAAREGGDAITNNFPYSIHF